MNSLSLNTFAVPSRVGILWEFPYPWHPGYGNVTCFHVTIFVVALYISQYSRLRLIGTFGSRKFRPIKRRNQLTGVLIKQSRLYERSIRTVTNFAHGKYSAYKYTHIYKFQ